MLTEKYRPKNLSEYIGNEMVVKAVKNYLVQRLKGKAIFPILILYGRSGVGKTTLAYCVSKDLGCEVHEINASDERNKKDILTTILSTSMKSFSGVRRITILDEADNISKSSQKILSQKSEYLKQPLILTVNDMEQIQYNLKKVSMVIRVPKPTFKSKVKFAQHIVHEENLTCVDLKRAVVNSHSYRDVIHNILSDETNAKFEAGKVEMIKAVLKGKISVSDLDIRPDELLRWIYQNDIKSYHRDVDILLKNAFKTKDFIGWKYAFEVLGLHRYDGELKRPRYEFKSKKKKKAKKEEKPEVVKGTKKRILKKEKVQEKVKENTTNVMDFF